MRTYVAIVRDHSVSMKSITPGARDDYNTIIQGIKDSTSPSDETFVSVVECGVGPGAINKLVEDRTNVRDIPELFNYHATGYRTPLLDAVSMAIENVELKTFPRPDDAYLVMVITDGEENASIRTTKHSLGEHIRRLQATDKWTFVFRGPCGSTRVFTSLGVAAGNIMEWDQTDAGIAYSTQVTTSATRSYFTARSAGATSTNSFYANINVGSNEVKKVVADTTDNFLIYHVSNAIDRIRIDEFMMKARGSYDIGRGFYQLTKTEKAVQDSKEIALRDVTTGKIYSGVGNVRALLGLPAYGSVKLVPGNHGQYEIFIQSTSVNRYLMGGTKVLYKK